ncbi:MAG: radical SAM protein [Pseudomonadota bacterium]
MNIQTKTPGIQRALEKFEDPTWTAKGERRAAVRLSKLDTLWINTGTLCNLACVNCYIESSPTNDALVYITADEAAAYYDEIETLGLDTREIGFTGGEPFMNPHMLAMTRDALTRGFEVLILTNAMQPMMRPRVRDGLLALQAEFPGKMTLRVSLDHHSQALHETERGENTWDKALEGLDWLAEQGFSMAIAGRTCWGEDEADAREGYAALIRSRGWSIDPADAGQLVLLPEMDEQAEVPEITVACWGILGIKPSDMMCATSRMVVKRKGAATPVVLPCTLIPFDENFEMAPTLAEAGLADGGMFANGAVKLCHIHCAKFCVLGGGSCSPDK